LSGDDAALANQSAHETYMRAAIEVAKRGMAAGEPPVGAVLVRDGEIVSSAHNSVISHLDTTAHAEIVAIREACASERKLNLDGCDLYSTVEPCPMCLAAGFYSGVRHVYFGASLADMQAITGQELTGCDLAAAEQLKQSSLLRDDCLALLESWRR